MFLFFIPAAILFVIGWFIKYKKVTWLISGYNTSSKAEKQTYNLDKLCKYMGNFIFILAGIFTAMAIAMVLFTRYINEITVAGFIILSAVIVGGIIYLNTGNRVKKG